MKMHRVKSSNVDSIGWHLGSLFVTFLSGETYEYVGVAHENFLEMLEGSKNPEFSVGKYLNQNIKRGGYAYKKASDFRSELIEEALVEKKEVIHVSESGIKGRGGVRVK